jgi:hypothetical protein
MVMPWRGRTRNSALADGLGATGLRQLLPLGVASGNNQHGTEDW